MDFLDLVSAFFTIHDYTSEIPMISTDLAAFVALLIFFGGIVFWLMILIAIVLGVGRGIVRLWHSAIEVISDRRVSVPQSDS